MKRIRIFARFLLVFMLSAYILPFTALTARAEETDKNKEFLQRLAGTYTSIEYNTTHEYSNADEYWKTKLKEEEESIHFVPYGFVMDYAINHIELKFDESGNASGSTSGSITVTKRREEPYHDEEHYIDYSLEVSSQITEKTTRKTFYVTGTLHEKYYEVNDVSGKSLVEKDYKISKPDPNFAREYENSLHIEVSDDKVDMWGLIYYQVNYKRSVTDAERL